MFIPLECRAETVASFYPRFSRRRFHKVIRSLHYRHASRRRQLSGTDETEIISEPNPPPYEPQTPDRADRRKRNDEPPATTSGRPVVTVRSVISFVGVVSSAPPPDPCYAHHPPRGDPGRSFMPLTLAPFPPPLHRTATPERVPVDRGDLRRDATVYNPRAARNTIVPFNPIITVANKRTKQNCFVSR